MRLLEVETTRKPRQDAQSFVNDFESRNVGRFVLGTNAFADSIASFFNIDGFIDNFSKASSHRGIPIINPDALPHNALVVATALGRPFTALEKVQRRAARCLDYLSFRAHTSADLLPLWNWDQAATDYVENQREYEDVFSRLADDDSRDTFEKIVNYRISLDLDWLKGFSDRQREQYFDMQCFRPGKGSVFLDVGAFDGTTSERYGDLYPDYDMIHVVEPVTSNMAVARGRLVGRRNILFYDVALSSTNKVGRFAARGQESRPDSLGDQIVEEVRLDDLGIDRISMAKFDIEGGELEALSGARSTIIRTRPVLAVAVYHRVEHLWRVPKLVMSYDPNYAIYLRHYNEGVSETVMYFVPR